MLQIPWIPALWGCLAPKSLQGERGVCANLDDFAQLSSYSIVM